MSSTTASFLAFFLATLATFIFFLLVMRWLFKRT